MVDVAARSDDEYVLADPDSVLTWMHDWTAWLGSSSPPDTISSRQWSIAPLTVTSPETPALTNDTTATVTVSGLAAGRVYRLVEHIVTASGLEADRTIVIRCDDR